MKTIDKKPIAPPQTTTSRGEAASKVQPENKNLSEKKAFRHPQAGCQPCLSFLYAISDASVPRSEVQEPPKAPAPGTHQMHDADQRFIAAGFHQARKVAKDFLSFLIAYDSGISPDDAQILCNAVNVIERSSA